MNKDNLPEYLYLYREPNTVIKLVLNDEKSTYFLDDGESMDIANIDSDEMNTDSIERLINGALCVDLYFASGDCWTVYTSADTAFSVNC